MTKKKILFVDDALKDDNGELSGYAKGLKLVLDKNYDLDFAISETEGIKKIEKGSYEIVSVDGNLHSEGHNLDADYESGKNVAIAAKDIGAYVIGASSEPERFGKIAGDVLDLNHKKLWDLSDLQKVFENKPNKQKFEEYEKVKNLGIKRILIADDNEDNLNAAKEYFNNIENLGIEISYVSSGEIAKEEIKKAADEKREYNFVMTDLEMEEAKTGGEVLKTAYEHGAEGAIITGFNYDKPDEGAHGPTTFVRSIHENFSNSSYSIKGKKSDPNIWKESFEKSLELSFGTKEELLQKALERYEENAGSKTNPVMMSVVTSRIKDITN